MEIIIVDVKKAYMQIEIKLLYIFLLLLTIKNIRNAFCKLYKHFFIANKMNNYSIKFLTQLLR